MHDQARIWFVTGASHGLGRVLARAARGELVVNITCNVRASIIEMTCACATLAREQRRP